MVILLSVGNAINHVDTCCEVRTAPYGRYSDCVRMTASATVIHAVRMVASRSYIDLVSMVPTSIHSNVVGVLPLPVGPQGVRMFSGVIRGCCASVQFVEAQIPPRSVALTHVAEHVTVSTANRG